MPNWTSNYLTLKGDKEELLALKESLMCEELDTVFDFNAIIPMPDSLNIEDSSWKVKSIMLYLYEKQGSLIAIFNDPHCKEILKKACFFGMDIDRCISDLHVAISSGKKTELLKNGEIYTHNIENYGVATWYDWCCNKWGTKWNACEAECQEREEDDGYVLEYYFDTAWSMPNGVIEELHKQHPNILLTICWSDEDEMEEHEVTLGGSK